MSVLAMKKKFPGKIFVEAYHEKDIRSSVDNFIDINLSKIQPFDSESYRNLFLIKKDNSANFKVGDYVRIKKGLYEDDVGKVIKIKKGALEVMLVPRINVQEIGMKMKEATRQMVDEEEI